MVLWKLSREKDAGRISFLSYQMAHRWVSMVYRKYYSNDSYGQEFSHSLRRKMFLAWRNIDYNSLALVLCVLLNSKKRFVSRGSEQRKKVEHRVLRVRSQDRGNQEKQLSNRLQQRFGVAVRRHISLKDATSVYARGRTAAEESRREYHREPGVYLLP